MVILGCSKEVLVQFEYPPQHGYIGLFKRGFGAIFNTHPNMSILGCSKEVLVQFEYPPQHGYIGLFKRGFGAI